MGILDKLRGKDEEESKPSSFRPTRPSSSGQGTSPLGPGMSKPPGMGSGSQRGGRGGAEQGFPASPPRMGQPGQQRQGRGQGPGIGQSGQGIGGGPSPTPGPSPRGPSPRGPGGSSEAMLSEISSKLDRIISLLNRLASGSKPPKPPRPGARR